MSSSSFSRTVPSSRFAGFSRKTAFSRDAGFSRIAGVGSIPAGLRAAAGSGDADAPTIVGFPGAAARGAGAEDAVREIVDLDDTILAEGDRRLEAVRQLADIARPRVFPKGLGDPVREARHREVLGAGDPNQQIIDEQIQVLHPLAQHRDADGGRGEAMEQIGAQLSGGDRFLGIAIGRCDEPHVDRALAGRADRADRVHLEDAQERHLRRLVHFCDFVEEEGAVLGGGDQPARVGDRTP